MRIVHRVAIRADQQLANELRIQGINAEVGFTAFDIAEEDRNWNAVRTLIGHTLDSITTVFNDSEVDQAAWLEVLPAWHHGYPKPDDDFGYLKATYDLSDYCDQCGSGYAQVASFRFSSEPKWGTKNILQLNWVYDEYFVLPELWEKVFRPLGIPCRPVVQHRSGVTLKTVVQLDIKSTAEGQTLLGAHQFEICSKCNRKKFLPYTRGRFPPLTAYPAEHIFKTVESFGSGGSSCHAVIISQELCSALRREKVKGVTFIPVAVTESEVTPPLPVFS